MELLTTAGKEVVDVTIAVEDEEMELPTTAGKEVVDVTIAVEDEVMKLLTTAGKEVVDVTILRYLATYHCFPEKKGLE